MFFPGFDTVYAISVAKYIASFAAETEQTSALKLRLPLNQAVCVVL
jgi:hypothetical protein